MIEVAFKIYLIIAIVFYFVFLIIHVEKFKVTVSLRSLLLDFYNDVIFLALFWIFTFPSLFSGYKSALLKWFKKCFDWVMDFPIISFSKKTE